MAGTSEPVAMETSASVNQNNSFGETVTDSNTVLEDIDDIELCDVDYKLFQEGGNINIGRAQNGPKVIVEKAASLSPSKPLATIVGEVKDPEPKKPADHAYY